MLDDSFNKISSSPEWRALWKKDWYRVYERKSWEIDHYLKSDLPDRLPAYMQSLPHYTLTCR